MKILLSASEMLKIYVSYPSKLIEANQVKARISKTTEIFNYVCSI